VVERAEAAVAEEAVKEGAETAEVAEAPVSVRD